MFVTFIGSSGKLVVKTITSSSSTVCAWMCLDVESSKKGILATVGRLSGFLVFLCVRLVYFLATDTSFVTVAMDEMPILKVFVCQSVTLSPQKFVMSYIPSSHT